MADFDEIDEIFKGRFDGVKNTSHDPLKGWSQIESILASRASASAPVSSGSSFLLQKIAASLFVALLSSVSVNESFYKMDLVAYESSDPTNEVSSFPFNTTTSIAIDAAAETSIQPKTQAIETVEASLLVNAQESSKTIAVGEAELLNAYAIAADQEFANSTSQNQTDKYTDINRSSLELIRTNKPSYTYQNPEIDDPNEIPEPILQKWMDDHIWFFRGGVRVGQGESNSYANDATLALNPSFSFGYGFTLSDRSFITVEIGVLRRTGNSIERVQQKNVSPIVASFANTVNMENDLDVHRGLVAHRLDYIHLPVMVNYVANSKWNLSAGGFTDYLFAAKNHSITVYNSEDYVEATAAMDEVNSMDGLNRVRFGGIIGVEREILPRLSAFTQLIVPINNAVDLADGYEAFGPSNRMVDSKVGLLYQF